MANLSKKTTQQIRIIGGAWRSRKIAVPDVEGLRPTPNRVRETLFNWLAPVIHQANCLDLFAGTGALSFEALSRGANSATCLEFNKQAITSLQQTKQLLKTDAIHIIHADALQWLKKTPTTSYDLVFLDPPFNQGLLEPICQLLAAQSWLSHDALIYLEYENTLTPSLPDNWQLHKQQTAGNVTSQLWQNK